MAAAELPATAQRAKEGEEGRGFAGTAETAGSDWLLVAGGLRTLHLSRAICWTGGGQLVLRVKPWGRPGNGGRRDGLRRAMKYRFAPFSGFLARRSERGVPAERFYAVQPNGFLHPSTKFPLEDALNQPRNRRKSQWTRVSHGSRR